LLFANFTNARHFHGRVKENRLTVFKREEEPTMTQPATRNTKVKPQREQAENFDFEQSSDLCDFGFVLVKTEDQAAQDQPAE